MNGSIFKLTAIWVIRGWLMTSSCGVLAQQVIGCTEAIVVENLKHCLDQLRPGLAIIRLRANVLPVTDPLFLKQRKWFYIGLKRAKPPE